MEENPMSLNQAQEASFPEPKPTKQAEVNSISKDSK
jgi:hypothetical protein